MEIVVIGDQHTLTGFSLAGVKRVYGKDEGKENLKKILSDDTAGVLIMTERFAENWGQFSAVIGWGTYKSRTPLAAFFNSIRQTLSAISCKPEVKTKEWGQVFLIPAGSKHDYSGGERWRIRR